MTNWERKKQTAANRGYRFDEWLFRHEKTGACVTSLDEAAGGGFHLFGGDGTLTDPSHSEVYPTFVQALNAGAKK